MSLLAWGFHWRTFGLQELGQDGYLSAGLGAGPLASMLVFLARDVHPPLFFALLHGLFALGGIRYPVAKFLPIAAAQLALPVAFCFARRLVGPTAAWLATFLLFTSVPFLLLAPTVRPFTLGLLCSLGSLLLTMRLQAQRRAGGPALPAALALVTAAGLLSWYLHAFVFALEASLFWKQPSAAQVCPAAKRSGAAARSLTYADRGSALAGNEQPAQPDASHWQGLAALAAGAALAAPWYAYVLPAVALKLWRGATVTEAAPPIPAPGAVVAGLIQALMGHVGGWPAVAAIGWVVALAAGLWRCQRTDRTAGAALRRHVLLGGLLLGVLEVGAILARWQHPDAAGRYLLGVLPFAAALQAFGLTANRRAPNGKRPMVERVVRLAAFAGVALTLAGQLRWYAGLLAIPPHNYEVDGESNFLATRLQPGDGVLFSDHGRQGQFLLNRRFSGDRPTAVVQTSGDRYLSDTAAEAAQAVTALDARAGRVWYVNTAPRPDRPPLGLAVLAARAAIVSAGHAGDSDISLFVTRPPSARRILGATLAGAVTLQSAAYVNSALPGSPVPVDLVWRDIRPLPEEYSVFVHLDNAAGALVAQQDGVPDAGLRPTPAWRPGQLIDDRHGLIVPANTAPGPYVVQVGIYKVSGARLTLPDGQNQIAIGEVQVGEQAGAATDR